MPDHRWRRSIAGAIAVYVGLASAVAFDARAGALSENANRADSLLGAGRAHAALEAFDMATEAFWQASPLQFHIAVFVDHAAGFGQYSPRADAQFHSGGTATVYLEPIGYGYVVDGPGFRVALTTGLEIRTPDGLIMVRTDDFGDLQWRGRTKSREVHATIAVALPDLKPGDYLMKLTLADRASAKSASVTMPFEIVP